MWNEIQPAFEKIEAEAKSEVSQVETVTTEEVEKLVRTIEENYEVVKNGGTEDAQEAAQKMYRAAQKLEALGEKM